jgi:hypothetical protein
MIGDPYLEPGRVPNIIAAIQAMGTLPWGTLPIDKWVKELEGSEEMAIEKRGIEPVDSGHRNKWRQIFAQHPEFFKLYRLNGEEKIALRWRFAQAIDYDPRSGELLSPTDLDKLKRNNDFFSKYTRRPLSADQIDVLIKTAIDLHSRVIAAQQDRRWHWSVLGTIIASVIGLIAVIAAALLKTH